MAGSDDLHLSLEICREILTRVPVKSVLRLRSVRKSWYSLISCPSFISDYSARNLNKNPNHVLLHLSSCLFSSHDKSFTESREHDEIPKPFLGGRTSIVGSCNGLICLMKRGYTDDVEVEVLNLVIWNPTIRKIVELPSTYVRSYSSWFGFGFDSKTSDYKVLSCSYIYGYPPYLSFQIFDLKKGVWRDISPHDRALLRYTNYYGSADFYLNGAAHWSGPEILLSFNFSDECFRDINLPDCAKFIPSVDDGDNKMRTRSMAFSGLIHLIVFRLRPNGSVDMSNSCPVWAMKEYGVTESWTKVYDIDLQSVQVFPSSKHWPLHFLLWEKGEVLMVHNLQVDDDEDAEWKQELVLHNPKSRKSECIFSITKSILDLCLYDESLVFM